MGILDFISGKKPEDAKPQDAAATAAAPAAPSAPAPAAPAGETIYEVKSGDSLWKIAEHVYGHGHGDKYTQIFEANKDQLDDPDSIQPGQKLRIPGAAHAAAGEWKPPQEVAAKAAEPAAGGTQWKPPEEIANKG